MSGFVIANNPSIVNLGTDQDLINATTTFNYTQTSTNPPQYSTNAVRLFTAETAPLINQALDLNLLPIHIEPWFKTPAPTNMLIASRIARSLISSSVGTPYTPTEANTTLPLETLVLQITFYVIDARIQANPAITAETKSAVRTALIGSDSLPTTRETRINSPLFTNILNSRAAISTRLPNESNPQSVSTSTDANAQYTAVVTFSSFWTTLNFTENVTTVLQNQDVADCFRFFNLIRRLENTRSALAGQTTPPLALIRAYIAAQYTVIYYLLTATLQNYLQVTANAAAIGVVYAAPSTNNDLNLDLRSLVKTMISINVALRQDNVTIQTLRTRILNFRASVNQQASLNERNNTRYALETSKASVLDEKQERMKDSYGMSRTTLIGLLVLLLVYIAGMFVLFQLPIFQIPGSSPIQYQPQFLKGVMIGNGLVAMAIVLYDMVVLLMGREIPKA